MSTEQAFRLVLGIILLVVVLLAVSFSIHWLWLVVFIGVNLVISAFTAWCPMMNLLNKLLAKPKQPATISAQQAKIVVDQGDAIVLDVREANEVETRAAQQTLHLAKSQLTDLVEQLLPNKQQVIFTHCAKGVRAQMAAQILNELGYTHVAAINDDLNQVCQVFGQLVTSNK